ncbi:MAG: Co2+/Mg2+ efflux protein ApaG [Gammaproteobacteria bacterium]|jgi:ApaG protein|nr:Co2+/Mg2+ efflux protein ApaG [Gammaproteobacteria bacterium]
MVNNPMNKIDIKVLPAYIANQSDPENNHFVFSYTVTIRNNGSMPAKLLARHWVITDGDGLVQEVKGDGVIGEQPHLQPGESFQYTSGTFMNTPFGTMHGSYQMISDSGEKFDAEIPAFQLSVPNTLH